MVHDGGALGESGPVADDLARGGLRVALVDVVQVEFEMQGLEGRATTIVRRPILILVCFTLRSAVRVRRVGQIAVICASTVRILLRFDEAPPVHLHVPVVLLHVPVVLLL